MPKITSNSQHFKQRVVCCLSVIRSLWGPAALTTKSCVMYLNSTRARKFHFMRTPAKGPWLTNGNFSSWVGWSRKFFETKFREILIS